MKTKLIIIVLLLLIIVICLCKKTQKIENFAGFIDKYDETYVKLYNKVFNNRELIKYTIKLIDDNAIKDHWKKKDVHILEAGCGNGITYKFASELYDNVTGVDISETFLKSAKINNPTGKFVHDDLKNTNLFKAETFSHIFCFYDTLYHSHPDNEMNLILSNFNYWLKKKGVLCVHIFDRTKLDPAPKKFSQYFKDVDNIKHSLTYFKHFTHDAWWKVNRGRATYHEKYVFKNKNKKIKIHKLYIPHKEDIIDKIVKNKYKLFNYFDYKKLDIEDHTLYLFKKI